MLTPCLAPHHGTTAELGTPLGSQWRPREQPCNPSSWSSAAVSPPRAPPPAQLRCTGCERHADTGGPRGQRAQLPPAAHPPPTARRPGGAAAAAGRAAGQRAGGGGGAGAGAAGPGRAAAPPGAAGCRPGAQAGAVPRPALCPWAGSRGRSAPCRRHCRTLHGLLGGRHAAAAGRAPLLRHRRACPLLSRLSHQPFAGVLAHVCTHAPPAPASSSLAHTHPSRLAPACCRATASAAAGGAGGAGARDPAGAGVAGQDGGEQRAVPGGDAAQRAGGGCARCCLALGSDRMVIGAFCFPGRSRPRHASSSPAGLGGCPAPDVCTALLLPSSLQALSLAAPNLRQESPT